MRRSTCFRGAVLVLLVSLVGGGATASGATLAVPAPPWTVCPPVNENSGAKYGGCNRLIVVDSVDPSTGQALATHVLSNTGVPAYDGTEDELIGIFNADPNNAVKSLPVGSYRDGAFGFDGDGLHDPGGPPYAVAGDPQSLQDPLGYAGPRTVFGSYDNDAGTVSIANPSALAPGDSTYFSLELGPNQPLGTGGANDTLTTRLSTSQAPSPADVHDSATISTRASQPPTGTVTYSVYSDAACTIRVAGPFQVTIANGAVPNSPDFGATFANNASYYVVASYGGDANNNPAANNCGDEKLTFGTSQQRAASTTTSKLQPAAGGPSAAQLTVSQGTDVVDLAQVGGAPGGPTPTGNVRFTVFSDQSCQTQIFLSGPFPLTASGSGGPSAPLANQPVGTYYWTAAYSGDQNYLASATPCAGANSEVLTVRTPPVALQSVEGSELGGVIEQGVGCPGRDGSQVTIDWGDGTAPSTAAIVCDAVARTYTVSGRHTYAEEGSFAVVVTFTDGSVVSGDGAQVTDAALHAAPVRNAPATAGSPFSGTVARFRDDDPAGAVPDYAATIDWGDGTRSAGTVRATDAGFAVTGGHSYATKQIYPVAVDIADAGGAHDRASSSIAAAAAPPRQRQSSAGTTTTPPSGPPPPVIGQTFNLLPEGGEVTVTLPDGSVVALSSLTQIPNGAIVNATRGIVRLFAAGPGGTVVFGDFYAGEFALHQDASGLTTLTLHGGDFGACQADLAGLARARRSRALPANVLSSGFAPGAFASRKLGGASPVRRLWGSAHGRFRIAGNYATASVRGTLWTVQDFCGRTKIRVVHGILDAQVGAKNVALFSGDSLLAGPGGPSSVQTGQWSVGTEGRSGRHFSASHVLSGFAASNGYGSVQFDLSPVDAPSFRRLLDGAVATRGPVDFIDQRAGGSAIHYVLGRVNLVSETTLGSPQVTRFGLRYASVTFST